MKILELDFQNFNWIAFNFALFLFSANERYFVQFEPERDENRIQRIEHWKMQPLIEYPLIEMRGLFKTKTSLVAVITADENDFYSSSNVDIFPNFRPKETDET